MAARGRGAAALLFALAASACAAYDPPVRADHASARYRDDLAACRTQGDKEGATEVARHGYKWMLYPIYIGSAQRQAIRACLLAKGYVPQPV